MQDLEGKDRSDGLLFKLAAQINLAADAESCPAVDEAVGAGQFLLRPLHFDGSGKAPGADLPSEDREVAQFLAEQLAA